MCNGYYARMRVFFLLGLVLLGFSFILAAAENASHAVPGTAQTFIIPAHDLWYTFWPKSLLIFELRVQRYVGDWLWDPVMLTILKLPAWLIFGGPGVALLLFFRPKQNDGTAEEMNEVVESFELYDQLTKQALEENPTGEEHGPLDIMPETSTGEADAIDENDALPEDEKPDKEKT